MEPQLETAGNLGRRLMQRWLRRPSVAATPREARVIAVASGKGGTGKSFLASNLAVALHQEGRRVIVVDCDFGLGNAHLLLGVNPRHALHHLLSGEADLEQTLVATPFGPMLVAGGSGISGLAEFDARQFLMLARALGAVARMCDVVILDCAAGLSTQTVLTMLGAEHVVLVTNPEIAALTDAYALVKCLARHEQSPDIHLVVNRVTEAGQGRPTFERLADVARKFVGRSLHYLGEVADNPNVSHRRLGQPPLIVSHEECNESKSIRSILNGLEVAAGPMLSGMPAMGVEQRLMQRVRAR